MATRRLSPSTAAKRAPPPAPAAAPIRTTKGTREERATGYVATSIRQGKQDPYDEKHYEVEARRTEFAEGEEAGSVRLGAGLTISMGNFESLRVDCAVTVPCRDSDAGYEEAYEFASQFVSDKISEEQALWLGEGNQKKGRG